MTQAKNLWRWWQEGLLLLNTRRAEVTIHYHNNALHIHGQMHKEALLPTYTLSLQQEWNAHEIEQLSYTLEANIVLKLLLPMKDALQGELSLPLSAEPMLDSVLVHEIERRTPFNITQLYYDFKIVDRDTKRDKLKICFVLIPLKTLQPILDRLKNNNIKPHIIDVEENDACLGYNFSPQGKDLTISRNIPYKVLLPITLAIAFAIAHIYLAVWQQHQHIKQLEQQIDSLAHIVPEMQNMQNTYQTLQQRHSFLQQQNYIQPIDVLNNISTVLPQDSALKRLTISEEKIILQGESANASTLIALLESLPYLTDAKFQSPVILNKNNNREQFTILASWLAKSTQ